MGLASSIVRGVFGIDSGLVGGATTFVEPAAAAIAGVWVGQLAPRRATILGAAAVAAGASLIVVAVLTANLPAMVIGGVIGGVGFGASFSGALRSMAPLAGPHQRAGLFAAVYLVGYVSFGVPVILAGLLITPLGLTTTVAGYGAAVVITAAAGLLAQSRGRLAVAIETS
jgi:MFS family permease